MSHEFDPEELLKGITINALEVSIVIDAAVAERRKL